MSKGVGSSSSEQQDLPLAFITISDQDDIKDPKRQQQARTQAIKHSLQRKRRQLQLTNQNFVDETSSVGRRHGSQRGRRREVEEAVAVLSSPPPPVPGPPTIDPFESIAVDAVRLTTLLHSPTARQAGDPVFSVNPSIDFQGLRRVFDAGLEDASLASAICLALAFAENGGQMNQECSSYRLTAIQHVNEKLSNHSEAASTATIGAVLLLVGVEARLGERDTAQMHLNGTRQLLVLCNERRVYLSHAIKRAIFWQDLFCSIVAGTARVFSHDTFPEMHWHRDPYQAYLYSIPPGFAIRIEALGSEFIEIIGDICALQRTRESQLGQVLENDLIEKLDNQQAWIESRLEQLRHTTIDPLLLCCIPAAYLCAYGFFTDIWSGSLIPSRVTSCLLQELQVSEYWEGWDEHADILLWLLNIGTAFAVDSDVRLGFAGLWHGSHRTRLQPLSQSWEDAEQLLRTFIWSDDIHGAPSGTFGQRLHEL